LDFTKKYEGADVMTNNEIYVLKDEEDNYVGVNSISYDKLTRENIYSFSDRLVNGYYTYTNKSDAINELELLQQKGQKINFGITFHIEKINMLEIIKNESNLGIKAYPFKNKIINEELVVDSRINEGFVNHQDMCGVGV